MQFNPELAQRPQVIVGNKIDLLQERDVEKAKRSFEELGVPMWPISVATGAGVRDVVMRTYRRLEDARTADEGSAPVVRRKVYRLRAETGFSVERSDEGFIVRGEVVEKAVRKLILNSQDALEYLTDRLERMGVLRELRQHGFTEGDAVRIGEVEFELEG
ncbi:Obg family GTPase CgtA [Candidatus Bipolaricaulota bacterium]